MKTMIETEGLHPFQTCIRPNGRINLAFCEIFCKALKEVHTRTIPIPIKCFYFAEGGDDLSKQSGDRSWF